MQTKIIIELNSDKLSALNMFLKQKNITIEKEMTDYAESLYQKHVPTNVRDFISQTEGAKSEKKRQQKAKIKKAECNATEQAQKAVISVPEQRSANYPTRNSDEI